jgi:hypothetical protein
MEIKVIKTERQGTAKYLKMIVENSVLVLECKNKHWVAYLKLLDDKLSKQLDNKRIFLMDDEESEYNRFQLRKSNGFYRTFLSLQSGDGSASIFRDAICTEACKREFNKLIDKTEDLLIAEMKKEAIEDDKIEISFEEKKQN